MELKITNKQDNPLLSRYKIEAEATFFKEATPKEEEVRKRIAAAEKADEKLVVVRKIHTLFGEGKANVLAFVYNSEEKLKRVEPRKKEKKSANPAEAAKEEAKKEEAKGE